MERPIAWLSIGAGLIHAALMPSHFQEWWGYGLFFMGAALAQILFGLALLTDAISPEAWGPGWQRARRALYIIGIVLNVAILVLYTITRTVGIPFFGPEAGEVGAVGTIDIVSKVIEIVVIVGLVVLLRRPLRDG